MVLCMVLLLAGCKDRNADTMSTLSGQLVVRRDGSKGGETNLTDLRIYAKSTFEAALAETMQKAKGEKRGILDGAQKERDNLTQELRYRQLEKEQTERSKEALANVLASTNGGVPSNTFREEMYSLGDKLEVIGKAMEKDRQALTDLEVTEREAQILTSHNRLVSSLLEVLPKPLKEIQTDADGRFHVPLDQGEYVVVANASCGVAGNVEIYQTSISLPVDKTPSATLMSLYQWDSSTR